MISQPCPVCVDCSDTDGDHRLPRCRSGVGWSYSTPRRSRRRYHSPANFRLRRGRLDHLAAATRRGRDDQGCRWGRRAPVRPSAVVAWSGRVEIPTWFIPLIAAVAAVLIVVGVSLLLILDARIWPVFLAPTLLLVVLIARRSSSQPGRGESLFDPRSAGVAPSPLGGHPLPPGVINLPGISR
jgi:hypothetical protein